MLIEIVRRPIGEAPEWVRDAWIGVRIPLARDKMKRWHGVGVLSGPHGFMAQLWCLFRGRAEWIDGYAVNAKLAVDALHQRHPDAALWWRENASMWLDGRRNFVFDADACRLWKE
jgi:hypothetical protein